MVEYKNQKTKLRTEQKRDRDFSQMEHTMSTYIPSLYNCKMEIGASMWIYLFNSG